MPHFAHLVAQQNEERLALEYHRWNQIFIALILPITGTFIVFGRPLLQLWLGSNSPLVEPVFDLLPWIAIGTLFNTVMTAPYFLQIASGWTLLSVVKNAIAVAIILPVLVITVPLYGPIAAAACWIGLNVGYYLLEVPYMHRRLLPRELWTWWGRDTLLPMATVGVVYTCVLFLVPPVLPRLEGLALTAIVAIIAWLALLMVLPLLRSDAFYMLRRLKQWLPRAD